MQSSSVIISAFSLEGTKDDCDQAISIRDSDDACCDNKASASIQILSDIADLLGVPPAADDNNINGGGESLDLDQCED
jgi:hypothetical protein